MELSQIPMRYALVEPLKEFSQQVIALIIFEPL